MNRHILDETAKNRELAGYQSVEMKFDVTMKYLHTKNDGSYYIINSPLLHNLGESYFNYVKVVFKSKLKILLKEIQTSADSRVLFVGLGNSNIISDALGAYVTNNIISNAAVGGNVYKFNPDVFSKTGINSFDVVHAIVDLYNIKLVVAIDSLITNSLKRLGVSFQLNSKGITPGSGLHKLGKSFNEESLGVPVIAIGVPFMIAAKSLNRSAEDFVLTPKDSEENIERAGKLISDVLNEIFVD